MTLNHTDLIDYILTIPSKSRKIHILFNCTWNSLQDRSHNKPQNKPQWIWEYWNHIKHLFWSQWHKTRNQLQECIKNKNNMLLDNQWVTEKIKEEIKKTPEDKWIWKHNDTKSMNSKSCSMREVYSNTDLSYQTRKISNKQSNSNNHVGYSKKIYLKFVWSTEGKETEIR